MRAPADDTLLMKKPGGPSRPADRRRALPERLGRYQILHELGKGAMGVVYRARDPMINREVALKAIPLAADFDTLVSCDSVYFTELATVLPPKASAFVAQASCASWMAKPRSKAARTVVSTHMWVIMPPIASPVIPRLRR